MSTTYEKTVQPEPGPHAKTHHVYHDSNSPWKASTTIVLSLKSLTGDESTQMLPLNRAIDPDVLESHLQGRDRGAHLSFEFHGYTVKVRDDGQITFTPAEEI
jgi:hypothetical protein